MDTLSRGGGVLQSEFEILRVPIQCKHLGVADKWPISDMGTLRKEKQMNKLRHDKLTH